MAIELAYMNLVIPIEKIEKHYLGGLKQYKIDNEKSINEHDDYVVMKSAMTMEEIEFFAKECEFWLSRSCRERRETTLAGFLHY